MKQGLCPEDHEQEQEEVLTVDLRLRPLARLFSLEHMAL